MKYQLGDKVILIHSGEEGTIVDFINKKMVMVDVNGVTFPVYTDQVDFPYFKQFSARKEIPSSKKILTVESVKKEKNTRKYPVGEGIWLVWMPVFDKDVFDDDIVEYFRLYLVNQTNDDILFHYRLSYGAEKDFELKNEIASLGDLYVHDIPFERLNDSPKLVFEFSLKKPDRKRVGHFEAVYKPNPKKIFRQVQEMRMQNLAHFYHQLLQEWPGKPVEPDLDYIKLGQAGFKVSRQDRHGSIPPMRTVVDLHIEKLADDWKQLSPASMLDLQLRTFEKHYEQAVLHHQPSLIIVHGVGTGRLRDEIHDMLRHKKEVKSFVNQYHPSFGYGATEIYFQH
jgi:hypothetical protein